MTVTRYIGSCPVCEGDYRLHKMQMVHHGYRRPGHGSIEGDCPGVGWAPWELSPDGTVWYVAQLRARLAATAKYVDRVERGEITQLLVEELDWQNSRFGERKYKTKTLTPADGYEFKRELENRLRRAQREVQDLTADIARRETRIANWREQPVRTEEEDMARKQQASAASRALRDEARAARQAKRDAITAKNNAREQERLDLMNEYRAIFNALAFDGTNKAKAEATLQWAKMHKRMSKKGYLRFQMPELQVDEALLALGLAEPNKRPHGTWQYVYSNDLGWPPRQ